MNGTPCLFPGCPNERPCLQHAGDDEFSHHVAGLEEAAQLAAAYRGEIARRAGVQGWTAQTFAAQSQAASIEETARRAAQQIEEMWRALAKVRRETTCLADLMQGVEERGTKAVEEEREECAKIASLCASVLRAIIAQSKNPDAGAQRAEQVATDIAAGIRARGATP